MYNYNIKLKWKKMFENEGVVKELINVNLKKVYAIILYGVI